MTLGLVILAAALLALVTPIGVTHGVAGLFGLFESSSSSSSSSSTTNIDKRLVNEGAGATNISGDNAQVSLTDQGTVHEAFGFATNALNNTLAKASDAIDSALEQYTNSAAALKDAYTESKAGEQKVLVVTALVITAGLVGLIAIRLTKGKA